VRRAHDEASTAVKTAEARIKQLTQDNDELRTRVDTLEKEKKASRGRPGRVRGRGEDSGARARAAPFHFRVGCSAKTTQTSPCCHL